MNVQAKHFYDFGAYRLDARDHLLLRDGEVVPLAPKAFDLLLVLVEDSGRVLSKEELMKLVWPAASSKKPTSRVTSSPCGRLWGKTAIQTSTLRPFRAEVIALSPA
jgi:DNA-binding winged helix-turn-helix (wHTH) protein